VQSVVELINSIVQDLPLVCSRDIGVHRRASAVAEGFGCQPAPLSRPSDEHGLATSGKVSTTYHFCESFFQ